VDVAVLDTNLFVSVLAHEAGFEGSSAAVLDAAVDGRYLGVVSTITIAELSAGFEASDDPAGREALLTRLYGSKGFRVMDVTRPVAELGGSLCSRYRLRLPDALVAATGMAGGATSIVTHDHAMAKLSREGLRAVSARSFLRTLRGR
jgi:predicted nucleic acid-binding protein